MKKITWRLLIVALVAASLAFAGKPNVPRSLHRYAFWQRSMDGLKYYTSKDLSAVGWQKGIDYDCVTPIIVCTFLADPNKIHTDLTGTWFYISDVPSSGVDSTGYFVNLNGL